MNPTLVRFCSKCFEYAQWNLTMFTEELCVHNQLHVHRFSESFNMICCVMRSASHVCMIYVSPNHAAIYTRAEHNVLLHENARKLAEHECEMGTFNPQLWEKTFPQLTETLVAKMRSSVNLDKVLLLPIVEIVLGYYV